MSTPADGPDVYKPHVDINGPAITTIRNEVTTKSGTVMGQKEDYMVN
jgi:hypothetical protein